MLFIFLIWLIMYFSIVFIFWSLNYIEKKRKVYSWTYKHKYFKEILALIYLYFPNQQFEIKWEDMKFNNPKIDYNRLENHPTVVMFLRKIQFKKKWISNTKWFRFFIGSEKENNKFLKKIILWYRFKKNFNQIMSFNPRFAVRKNSYTVNSYHQYLSDNDIRSQLLSFTKIYFSQVTYNFSFYKVNLFNDGRWVDAETIKRSVFNKSKKYFYSQKFLVPYISKNVDFVKNVKKYKSFFQPLLGIDKKWFLYISQYSYVSRFKFNRSFLKTYTQIFKLNSFFFPFSSNVKTGSVLSDKSILVLFLRKSKIFNKGRYSRNRQIYRTGVYWCLWLNVMVVFGLYYYFYRFLFNFGYLFWPLLGLVLAMGISRIIKYRYYNPLYFSELGMTILLTVYHYYLYFFSYIMPQIMLTIKLFLKLCRFYLKKWSIYLWHVITGN